MNLHEIIELTELGFGCNEPSQWALCARLLKQKPLLISAFPGTGKSYYTFKNKNCRDTDSSSFPKNDFPSNYIAAIKRLQCTNNTNIAFISSHKIVRDALITNLMDFVLVYPAIELKEQYLERYKQRNSPSAFINLLNEKWEEWIGSCKNQTNCFHYELQSGQFLSDIL